MDLWSDFERLNRAPGGAGAADLADRVLTALEAEPSPDPARWRALHDNVELWSGLGFGLRCAALLERWRAAGVEDDARAAGLATLAADAARGPKPTRGEAPQAGLQVISKLLRAEPWPAVEVAEAHDWFVDDLAEHRAFVHAVWALILLEDFERAEQQIERWKARHADAPEAYQLVLRTEARVAQYQHQYPRELALVEEAIGISRRDDLRMAVAQTEPALAAAYARNEEWGRVDALLSSWPDVEQAETNGLEAYRDLARLDAGLLRGERDAAGAFGRRALAFFERTNNAILASHVHFSLVLAADEARAQDALRTYERTTRRFQIPLHLGRLRLFKAIAEHSPGRLPETKLYEHSRDGRRPLDLPRLFTPPIAALGADLFYSRPQGMLYLAGQGPHQLEDHPCLQRALHALFDAPCFCLPIADFFARVWGTPYEPIRHEGKVHVTVHRLRAWLDKRSRRMGQLLGCRDGKIGFKPDRDVRVIEVDASFTDATLGPGLEARVLRALGCGRLRPSQLERRLGVSRSRLLSTLEPLIARGEVLRSGRGRATAYEVARCTAAGPEAPPMVRAD